MAGLFRPSSLMKQRRMFLGALGVAEQLPASVRPSVVIRRRAISHGLLGTSSFWRVVAVLLVLRRPIEGALGKHPRRVHSYRMGAGHSVRIAALEPTSRKQRKQLGLTKAKLRAEAMAELQDPNFRP